MTTAPNIFCPTAFVPAAVTQIVLVPGATTYIVKQCSFANVTSGDAQVTLYRVASGGSTGSGNTMLYEVDIPGNSTYLAQELDNLVLAAGDSLWALASSASTITATVSGFSVT